MSVTRADTQPLYRRRDHFPGYIDIVDQPKPRRGPLSSNNPFRRPSADIATSPFDDNSPIPAHQQPQHRIDRHSVYQQQRSVSDRDLSRPESVYSASTASRDSNYYSPVQSGPPNDLFMRRSYYNPPNRNSVYRKSTNPFIEDSSSPPLSPPTNNPYLQTTGSRHHSLDDVFDQQRVLHSSRTPGPAFQRPPNGKKPQFTRRSSSPNSIDSVSSGAVTIVKSHQQPPQHQQQHNKHQSRTKPIKASSSSSTRRRANSDSSIMEPPPSYKEVASNKNGDRATSSRSGSNEFYGDEKRQHRHQSKHHSSSSRDRDRERSGKSSSSSSKKKASKGLDVIDKLDVTGFYGPGRFHHDGPFDALNPHRNKNSKAAPVDAFPLNSANNTMSSVGMETSGRTTENRVMGRDNDEAYLDYNQWGNTRREGGAAFDPIAKAQPVHGDTTMGLGSSTFLDGAPASRAAIKESTSPDSRGASLGGAQGLGRKKSLVQRLRGNSGSGGAPPRPPKFDTSNYEPISRSSSYPEPSSPDLARNETKPHVTVQDREVPRNASGGSSSSGILRRVKSLKVGRPKN